VSNPLVDLGTLNKLRASVIWQNVNNLNVSASFLGTEQIALSLDGEATQFVPVSVGMVPSPQFYQPVTLSIHLVKTLSIAAQYQSRWKTNCLLGPGTVRPDVSTGIQPYDLVNMAIEGMRQMTFNGQDAGFMVNCRGYVYINSDLFG
jgi:hypothetical protein